MTNIEEKVDMSLDELVSMRQAEAKKNSKKPAAGGKKNAKGGAKAAGGAKKKTAKPTKAAVNQ